MKRSRNISEVAYSGSGSESDSLIDSSRSQSTSGKNCGEKRRKIDTEDSKAKPSPFTHDVQSEACLDEEGDSFLSSTYNIVFRISFQNRSGTDRYRQLGTRAKQSKGQDEDRRRSHLCRTYLLVFNFSIPVGLLGLFEY